MMIALRGRRKGALAGIVLIVLGIGIIVGGLAYVAKYHPFSSPSPPPPPQETPDVQFHADPLEGAAPLAVSFSIASDRALPFSTLLLRYGDGAEEAVHLECGEQGCSTWMEHQYESAGTFVATLLGKEGADSRSLGTLTVQVREEKKGSAGVEVRKRVGEREGSFLIQKIRPDSVEGLWFQAYPLPAAKGSPRTLHIGDDIGYACEGKSEVLTAIDTDRQEVVFTVTRKNPPPHGCPICLSGGTRIDTPSGAVPVAMLRAGMRVWTVDRDGNRVAGTVLRTARVAVSSPHPMLHLVLSDGRNLIVSPNHPTADGRTVRELAVGTQYDGAAVRAVSLIASREGATYDLLPSGATGLYWADGILVGSTLRNK